MEIVEVLKLLENKWEEEWIRIGCPSDYCVNEPLYWLIQKIKDKLEHGEL